MARYQVTKTFEFSYGHRLLNHSGKCRYLHGHNGVVEVDVESEQLDGMGMVVDFGDINEVVKRWVDENLDHRMLLCRADPMVEVMRQNNEPLFVMEENPTAENIAALVWAEAQKAGLQVTEVRLWETATSRASYSGPRWND